MKEFRITRALLERLIGKKMTDEMMMGQRHWGMWDAGDEQVYLDEDGTGGTVPVARVLWMLALEVRRYSYGEFGVDYDVPREAPWKVRDES